MRIRWDRILGLILVIVAVVLFVRNRNEIVGFLATIKQIGPGHTPEELTIGLLSFGLIVISILAAVRITQNTNDRSKP